jgi:ubiquinone/menaquinone biosynthesis C-methylase UbiE
MYEAPFYRQFYEQAGIREENVDAEERVPVSLDMIPNAIASVLDLGCGDGTLPHSMDSTLFKVGVDISYAALRLVTTGYRMLASASTLPFRERMFDVILCTEVLEHLPCVQYEKTVTEMERVAKKYILISVPYYSLKQYRFSGPQETSFAPWLLKIRRKYGPGGNGIKMHYVPAAAMQMISRQVVRRFR